MTLSRKLAMSFLVLAVILVALVAVQVWQTSRLAMLKESQHRAEVNAVKQEFGKARAGQGSTL